MMLYNVLFDFNLSYYKNFVKCLLIIYRLILYFIFFLVINTTGGGFSSYKKGTVTRYVKDNLVAVPFIKVLKYFDKDKLLIVRFFNDS